MRAVISSDASGMGRSSTSNVMTIAKTPSANASKRPLGRDFIISAFTLVYAHGIAVALSQHTSLSSSRNLGAISASEQIRPILIPSNSRSILVLNKYSYLRSNHKSMNGYEGSSSPGKQALRKSTKCHPCDANQVEVKAWKTLRVLLAF
jgi:hypothetical protein